MGWLRGMVGALALTVLALAPLSATAQDQDCGLRPITETHTLPHYPRDAVHGGKDGVTLLRVKIAPDGVPFATIIEGSSGSGELDATAAEHVKASWRWNPVKCSQDRITHVSVRWALHHGTDPGIIAGLGLLLLGAGLLYLGFHFSWKVMKSAQFNKSWLRSQVTEDTYRKIVVGIGAAMLALGGVVILTSVIVVIIATAGLSCLGTAYLLLVICVLLIAAIAYGLRAGWTIGGKHSLVRIYRSDYPGTYWVMIGFWTFITALLAHGLWLAAFHCRI